MPGLYLRKTVGSWSGGTRVEELEEIDKDTLRVRVLTGRRKDDEEFHRVRIVEVAKTDLVVRKS